MGEDFRLSGYLEIKGIDGLDQRIQEMQNKLGNLSSNVGLSKGFTEASKGAKQAAQETKNLNREIIATSTSAQDFADKAGLALRRFGAFTLAAGAVYGSARLVFGGLKEAAQFERQFIKVQQVTNATSTSLKELQDQISKLGSTLGAPASELVGVAKTLSQAGLSISQVKTILEGLAQTRLAATFGDVESTAQGVIAIMGQFKASAEEAKDALALTNSTAAKFAVESDGLITAVRLAGGAFSQASSGIDDTNTSLAKFYALITSVTQTTRQSPSVIATGLRTVTARLQRPSTANYLQDALGINVRDAEGKFIGVAQAIGKIQVALKDVDTRSELFAKTIEVIGGTRQYSVVVPLIREAALQNEILNKSLADQKNFLRDVELPLTTLASQFERLSANWSNFSRDVYNSPVFQFLSHQALDLATSLVKVADSVSTIVPLLAIVGGIKLAGILQAEGVLGVFKTRLFTGKQGAPGKAMGGYIPGIGSGDHIPIMAEPGEFVIRKRAAMVLGGSVLDRLNNADRYAVGGAVIDKTKSIEDELRKRYNIFTNKGQYSEGITPQAYHNNIARSAIELVRMSKEFSGLGQYRGSLLSSSLAGEKENPKLHLIMRPGDFISENVFGGKVDPSGGLFETAHQPGEEAHSTRVIEIASALNTSPSKLILGENNQLVGGNFNDVFRHEYGHYLDNSRIRGTQQGHLFDNLSEPYLNIYTGPNSFLAPKKGYPVSQYAATSPQELFAESFGAYTHPDYANGLGRLLPKELHEFMKRNFNPRRYTFGGNISGFGSGDKVPILAEPGEFIIRKAAAQRLGSSTLQRLNHAEKFAAGGFIEKGDDIIRNEGGFKDVSNLFIKEARGFGANFSSISKILKEVETNISGLPSSLEQTREGLKQFGGALQALKYKATPLSTSTLIGGGTRSGTLDIPRDALNQAKFAAGIENTSKGKGLEEIINEKFIEKSAEKSLEGKREVALNKVSQARLVDSLGLRDNQRAEDYINDTRTGPGQNTLFNTGRTRILNKGPLEVGANELGTTTYGKLSRTGLRLGGGLSGFSSKDADQIEQQYINEGLVSKGNVYNTQPTFGQRLRQINNFDFSGNPNNFPTIFGGGARGPNGPNNPAPPGGLFPSSGSNQRPISLARRFARARTRLREIGNSRATDPFLLGFGSTLAENYLPESRGSSIVTGGLAGASAGAFIGSTVGSVIPVLGTAAGAAIGAGVGAIGGGIAGYLGFDSKKEEEKNAKELSRATKELSKSFSDLSREGIAKFDVNLAKILNINERTSTKETAPGFLDRRFGNTNIVERTQSLAEKNSEVAQVARDRIRGLLKQGRVNEISDTELEAASSDNATANITGKSGRIIHTLAAVLPAEQKKADDENKISFAIRQIDLFQSRLSRSISSLESFNIELDKGANATQNIFNQSQGNFQENRSFVNPFNAIEGLSKDDITKEIGNLQNQLGKNINPEIRKTLQSIPNIENFSDILNDEIKKNQGKPSGPDTKNIAINLINDVKGPFKDLPTHLKEQFTQIFEGLDDAKLTEALGSGNKIFDSAKENFKQGAIKYAQALKDGANRIYKELQDDANLLSQNYTQRGIFAQNLETARGQGIELRNEVRGERPDANLSIFLQKKSIETLSGGTSDPDQILKNIRQLRADRTNIENSNPTTDKGIVDRERQLAENTSSLTRSKQALDQLAQSALGLSAIQTELADLQKRRQGAIGLSAEDAFGGNARQNFSADLAFKLFNTGGIADVAHSGLTPQDVVRGHQRALQNLEVTGSPKDVEEFEKKYGTKATQAGLALGTISPEVGAARLAAINNKQIDNLRDTIDISVQRQLSAIKAQSQLLKDNITLLDQTLENKFINGINNLGKIVDKFPETMHFTGKIEHTVNVIGPNYNGLDKYIKEVAERQINKAMSQLTEGRSSTSRASRTNADTPGPKDMRDFE